VEEERSPHVPCRRLDPEPARRALLWAAPAQAKDHVPIVFVHGNTGSAQQFETNAMRFTSNGYDDGDLFAYEYDSSATTNDAAIAGLDGFIAGVKAKTGARRSTSWPTRAERRSCWPS
jgi:triacylglycerol esterase/lipase EstA (alpha/beta hydrolase family)